MGAGLDPLTTETPGPTISNRAILIVMFALIGIGTVAGSVVGGVRVGAGILVGGILAVINYFWLERSTRAMFDGNQASAAWLLAAKYILRYAAIGGVLLMFYLTDAVPIAAVIGGLSSFAVAVVLQGLKNIYTSSF